MTTGWGEGRGVEGPGDTPHYIGTAGLHSHHLRAIRMFQKINGSNNPIPFPAHCTVPQQNTALIIRTTWIQAPFLRVDDSLSRGFARFRAGTFPFAARLAAAAVRPGWTPALACSPSPPASPNPAPPPTTPSCAKERARATSCTARSTLSGLRVSWAWTVIWFVALRLAVPPLLQA